MSALRTIPFEQARKLKWEQGRAEHRAGGTDEFVGDPVEEFYAEMLDATNYVAEMEKRGVHVPTFISASILACAKWAREL